MKHQILYLSILLPLSLSCLKDKTNDRGGELSFDEQGRPYYVDNTVSEREFYKTTRGKSFAVKEKQITLVGINEESTVDISQLFFIPEFIMDSNVMALTELYKINENTNDPQGAHQDIMYSLHTDGTLLNASNGNFIMRIISTEENSFNAFIQVKSRNDNSSHWAKVEYSTIKDGDTKLSFYHNEIFTETADFDNTGFPYINGYSIPLDRIKNIVNHNGWRTANKCYNFVDNNTGDIKHADDIIPGYVFTALFEDNIYYISRGDDPRRYTFNLMSDGTLQNDFNETELLIVYYDSIKFKAFILADKDIDKGNRYMLVDFYKMPQQELNQFKEKYGID